MFTPIENGTIFDMNLATTLGFILGFCVEIAYFRIMFDLGEDPTEKGAWRKFVKHIWNGLKDLVKEFRTTR